MTPPLLYVSVKVNPDIATSAQPIAGQIDRRCSHVCPVEGFAGHRRSWPTIVGTGRWHLANANRVTFNAQWYPAGSFAARQN
jgi:hypothetical protein